MPPRSPARAPKRPPPSPARDPWRVAILAHENLCTFEFGVAIELFALPRPGIEDELGRWYRTTVCTEHPGDVRARGGVKVEVTAGLGVLDRAGTIVIPGWSSIDAPVSKQLATKLVRAHERGARLVSICSGAFVLAAAGLLDGLRATTHWLYSDELARRYPNVHVDPNVLFVDEGQVITSAGSAAGIDAGLHLIRRDAGAAVAKTIARRLVVPPQREGGQQQFIRAAVDVPERGSEIAQLMEQVTRHLDREHTVESMAAAVHLSPRTFARRFVERAGTTPHRWLTTQRVARAQALLETTDEPLERIAELSGFGEPQLLRLHFKRAVGTPPAAYRRTFR